MDKAIDNKRGITLIALVITIIVILILTGIGIGASTGIKGNISKSKDAVAISDLSKVKQAVLENYIKYKQTGNERVLKGIAISYEDAQAVETEFKKIDSSVSLRQQAYELDSKSPEVCYYKLQKMHLEEMGLQNVEEDVEYIVNYSTGEVFNNTEKKTGVGNILYTYAK